MDLRYSIGEALGTDYFGLREPFTAQQEGYLVRTREFVDAEVLPVINGYWERADGYAGWVSPALTPHEARRVRLHPAS